MSSTSTVTTNGTEPVSPPYARLESTHFGIYDVWQEKTVVGRKTNRREVDVDMGSTSLVSRVHFELLLVTGTDFQLKCLSKNGLFVNNNYMKMSATTVLPKQCSLRFPSTEICISFSSLVNRTSPENLTRHVSTDSVQPQQQQQQQQRLSVSSLPIETPLHQSIPSSLLLQSVPNASNQQQQQQQQQQQVILVTVNQHAAPIATLVDHESNANLPSLCTNISNMSSSNRSVPSVKSHYENPIAIHLISNSNSQLGSSLSSCSTSPKPTNYDTNENHALVSSPIIQRLPAAGTESVASEQDGLSSKNGTKPPFSYAQLIVQAILSAPDKQMTLSQIYSFISAQYPYYEANNRGWQNSIRHNLSLNRYFIRLARKDNESGKGSFWRLDQSCEEKLIDHAFRHRKQRGNFSTLNSSIGEINSNKSDEAHSPTAPYPNDATEFFLADLHTSNPSTPLSPMTSPLVGPMIEAISPNRPTEDHKRKFSDDDDDDEFDDEQQIQDLLHELTASIDESVKRQKTSP